MDEAARAAFLVHHGLAAAGEPQRWTPLTGGVSSEIWCVESAGHAPVCVKRALAKLRVAADWHAPVSRNAFEWAWLEFASGIVPDAVPTPLAHDPQAGLFAMRYLAPDAHPVWKQQLLAGKVEAGTAASVGRVLAAVHQASAGRAALRAAFDTTDVFIALRLEPYLLHTARAHPALAPRLQRLAEDTVARRSALVHGDVSPKNILVGPRAPVLLDAECAWYGDPAFDLAFCLNHLLLKAVVRPDRQAALRAAFDALVASYFGGVQFEARETLEARVAALLPALLLARVDGKSPVEYLVDAAQRERVRRAAMPLIARPAAQLDRVAHAAYPVLADPLPGDASP